MHQPIVRYTPFFDMVEVPGSIPGVPTNSKGLRASSPNPLSKLFNSLSIYSGLAALLTKQLNLLLQVMRRFHKVRFAVTFGSQQVLEHVSLKEIQVVLLNHIPRLNRVLPVMVTAHLLIIGAHFTSRRSALDR